MPESISFSSTVRSVYCNTKVHYCIHFKRHSSSITNFSANTDRMVCVHHQSPGSTRAITTNMPAKASRGGQIAPNKYKCQCLHIQIDCYMGVAANWFVALTVGWLTLCGLCDCALQATLVLCSRQQWWRHFCNMCMQVCMNTPTQETSEIEYSMARCLLHSTTWDFVLFISAVIVVDATAFVVVVVVVAVVAAAVSRYCSPFIFFELFVLYMYFCLLLYLIQLIFIFLNKLFVSQSVSQSVVWWVLSTVVVGVKCLHCGFNCARLLIRRRQS